MGKEMALAQSISIYLPALLGEQVCSFHFEFDLARIESIWQDLKRGGQAETCRLWLFAGINPDQADLLRDYLDAPEQAGAAQALMGELLPFLGRPSSQIGRFEMLF
ncbi:MAG: hypothetical protein A2508_04620 [Candidatus Lambdaproteobacteria bacterium RIFOXYD12_FULL_49_8]|uniref:Uncharacterized protein n=1 Tax=Candidatus Lambdaproteobacteria bacterium RIFOXYD2_FULL_50_16 TaxID=1817772 RepID=A0A1F6G9C2_9PROT|nr:MAG: hypothetical protein A2527_05820 [Candidatus Lambdaproteobacteria bacterium RIFOXYD2_FULL_50_16]OGG97745.1 MAG: hypothetical protein A2508_04620 [Candidatus Lambdaproteobacteria bacterium RIFOXYD12_FULL_49_8]